MSPDVAVSVSVEHRRRVFERLLTVVLAAMALDAIYLSWRFTALFAGWAEPGTGLCSWSDSVDCDKVLQTPEARAFWVPNAILGLGFYSGALIWWILGHRLGPAHRLNVIRILTAGLGVATLMTFWFWRLLLGLAALCPFCPWNHILTYIALALAFQVMRMTPPCRRKESIGSLLGLGAACIVWFWAWQILWFVAEANWLPRA